MCGAFTVIIETSTPAASLALVTAEGGVSERGFTSDRSHNAVLFPILAALLAGRAAREIGLVIVGSGPGSYSGTRVGIAAAQGVAIAAGCPAVAVPSLLATASGESGAECLAIGDARRGSFWTAGIKDFRLLAEPELTDAAGLMEQVAVALEAGFPVGSFESPARFPLPDEMKSQVCMEIPSAGRLWQVWERADEVTRQGWRAGIPQPIYLKPPHITPAKRPWLVLP